MKLAKSAVAYYTEVTGYPWSQFFDKLDLAMASNLDEQSGELWLIHSLMNVVVANGMTVNEFKVNKDAIKGVFDSEGRKLAGEFFTPILWAEELHKYLDKHVSGWRTDYNVWEGSCYSEDTEILTTRGWVTYDGLRDEDYVYTRNPHTGKGEWSGFYNRFSKDYCGDMYRVKGSKFDFLVTPDHRMGCSGSPDTVAEELWNMYAGYNAEYSCQCFDIAAESESNPLLTDETMVTSEPEFWYIVGAYIRSGNGGAIYAGTQQRAESIRYCLDSFGAQYSEERCNFILNSSKLLEFLLNNADGKVPFDKVLPMYMKYLFYGIMDNMGYLTDFSKGVLQDICGVTMECARGSLLRDIELLGIMTGHHITVNDGTLSAIRVSRVPLYRYGISKEYYVGKVWDLTTCNDNHVFMVRRNGKAGFSGNCGSGNLIRTAGVVPEHLFASSLQDDDITLIKNTPELVGCNAFQLDFLSACANPNIMIDEFIEKLPSRLQEVLRNNEPLVFLMNPPYKVGQANSTEVGKYMSGCNTFYNNVDFSKPAYDLFYQFCFQVMNIVSYYGLTNCYYAVFGPLTWFTGAGANVLLKEFEKTFEFLDGMCISAQEFSDTSTSILWGIGATLWKSRGGYDLMPSGFQYHKDVLLDKKFIAPDGTVGCSGKILYAPPREKLSSWVELKPEERLCYQEDAPLMTSHLTFKGAEIFEKRANKSGKIAKNALGTLMVGNTLTRSADQSAILSMPSTISYVSITEENFWRCVGSYAFRRVVDAGWAIAKKEISAPDTTVEGYDLWLRNALVLFLFEYKSMMSSIRNVDWMGQLTQYGVGYNIYNKLFYLSESEVREHCHDEVILKDMEEHPFQNQFMLRMIEESKPYWAPEVKQLYDWCVAYTLSTYDFRKSVGYKGSLECADAGFQQLRSGLWDADRYDADLTKLVVQARDWCRRDIPKFGFVSEVIDDDL